VRAYALPQRAVVATRRQQLERPTTRLVSSVGRKLSVRKRTPQNGLINPWAMRSSRWRWPLWRQLGPGRLADLIGERVQWL